MAPLDGSYDDDDEERAAEEALDSIRAVTPIRSPEFLALEAEQQARSDEVERIARARLTLLEAGITSLPAAHDEPSGRHIEPTLAEEWPEPLDLSTALYRGLPLPLELTPKPLQALIADCTNRTGIDAGAYFTGFLGSLAGIANDFIRLQPKQNDHTWTVRPVVWPLAIGGSSSGKSPAIEEGMRYVQQMDEAAVIENTRKRKDYEHALKIYDADCAQAVKNKAPRPAEPELPELRELWVSRGTTEGLTRVLETSPKVTVYIDEISALINSMDRYAASGKGSGDREFYLMLWNGGPGKNTLAGKTISIKNASAVICGGTTPTAMRQAAGKLQADGFLQRTLLALVPKKRNGADVAPDAQAYAQWQRILDNLNQMHPCTLLLSTEAQAIYNRFDAELTELEHAEENDSLSAHLGKWHGLAPRLMLLYHLTELASHGQLPRDGDRIPMHIAEQVCRLFTEWQLSHLRAFWHEMMNDRAGRKFSVMISRYVLGHPNLQTLDFRDHIARPHWREMDKLKPWELRESINTLVSAAWLTPIDGKPNSYGLPAKYRVNPRIGQFFEGQREQEIERRAHARDEFQALKGGIVPDGMD